MSIILNETALRTLLESELGPVFQRALVPRAEIARDALQTRMNGIIQNPEIQPKAGIEVTPEGVVVGIVDEAAASASEESISEYLDFKLGVLEPWWFELGEEAAGGSG